MADDIRRLIKALEAEGFSVKRTSKNHWLIRNPEGRFVTTMAGTPSDRRGWRNAVAALRRAGFKWPPDKR